MLESTWVERRPSFEDQRTYRLLLMRHEMTKRWFSDLKIATPDAGHLLTRVAAPEARAIWDRFAGLEPETSGLEAALREEYPSEYLERLDVGITTLAANAITALLEKTARNEHAALVNSLEQSSWQTGRDQGARIWGSAPIQGLADVHLCLKDTPFYRSDGIVRQLLIRSTSRELMFEIRACPHTSKRPEIKPVSDILCLLEARWVGGFVQALAPSTRVDHTCSGGSCTEVWSSLSSRL